MEKNKRILISYSINSDYNKTEEGKWLLPFDKGRVKPNTFVIIYSNQKISQKDFW